VKTQRVVRVEFVITAFQSCTVMLYRWPHVTVPQSIGEQNYDSTKGYTIIDKQA